LEGIPLPLDYYNSGPMTQFDISPHDRHIAFSTLRVLQATVGMLENIHYPKKPFVKIELIWANYRQTGCFDFN